MPIRGTLRKAVLPVAATGLILGGVLTGAAPARANGADVAAGMIGGFALGTIISGGAYPYPPPPPVYYAPPPPPPVYYAPAPVPLYDEPDCYPSRRQVWVPGYGWRWDGTMVCD